MRITCPHCQANYETPQLSPDAMLVCYRCGEEFPVAVGLPQEQADAPSPKPEADAETGPAEPVPGDAGEEAEAPIAADESPVIIPARDMEETESEAAALPERRPIKLWPWLAAMLLLVAAAGFWVQKDAWMNNLWFRSTLMSLGNTVAVRDGDWVIQPKSLRSEWLQRDDGSHVLVITGRVSNRLACELPLPELQVKLFDNNLATSPVDTRLMPITLPPLVEVITHAPFRAPEADHVPVAPRGQRAFILVLESVPQPMAYFTLQPKAVQP